jgi:hypothetical protein
LLAVVEVRQASLVFAVVELIDRLANAEQAQNGLQEAIKLRTDAKDFIVEDLLSVEGWHTLAADLPSHHVLVSVEQSVDPCIAKLANQSLDFVKVSAIV